MNVETFMTPRPQTVEASASLRTALSTMDEHRLRHLPVTRDGSLVGLVSDRDLLADAASGSGDGSTLDSATVAERMHSPPVTVGPRAQIVSVAVQLQLDGIGSVLVVDGGELLGIVTETDLLKLLVHASSDDSTAWEVDAPVADHMSRDVVTLDTGDTLAHARAMRDIKGVRHFPVLRDGAVAGMVSDRDLRLAEGMCDSSQRTVREAMASDVVSLSPASNLSEAARLMVEHKISAMPIVDDGRLVGILTSTDLVDHGMNTLRSS